MVGQDGLNNTIIFAPSEQASSPEIAPVCILPPSSDISDNWNSTINSPFSRVYSTKSIGGNLSFSFCRSKYYFYERYSFSMLGGMKTLVQSCKERIFHNSSSVIINILFYSGRYVSHSAARNWMEVRAREGRRH